MPQSPPPKPPTSSPPPLPNSPQRPYLDEEELRLPGEGRALVSFEILKQVIRIKRAITAPENVLLPVRHEYDCQRIAFRVVYVESDYWGQEGKAKAKQNKYKERVWEGMNQREREKKTEI